MTKRDWTRTNGGDAGELMTPVESSIDDDRRLLVDYFEQSVEAAAESVRRNFVDLLRPYDLSVAQYAVLVELKKRDAPARIHELGNVATAFPDSIFGMIEQITHLEMVTLSGGTADDRQIIVTLTDAGRAIIDDVGLARRQQITERSTALQDRQFALIVNLFDVFARSSRSA